MEIDGLYADIIVMRRESFTDRKAQRYGADSKALPGLPTETALTGAGKEAA